MGLTGKHLSPVFQIHYFQFVGNVCIKEVGMIRNLFFIIMITAFSSLSGATLRIVNVAPAIEYSRQMSDFYNSVLDRLESYGVNKTGETENKTFFKNVKASLSHKVQCSLWHKKIRSTYLSPFISSSFTYKRLKARYFHDSTYWDVYKIYDMRHLKLLLGLSPELSFMAEQNNSTTRFSLKPGVHIGGARFWPSTSLWEGNGKMFLTVLRYGIEIRVEPLKKKDESFHGLSIGAEISSEKVLSGNRNYYDSQPNQYPKESLIFGFFVGYASMKIFRDEIK